MAYYSQERKKSIQPAIKALLKEYGLKGSLSVEHHSVVHLNIWSGDIDFIGQTNKANKESCERRGQQYYEESGYVHVNHYHLDSTFTGDALRFLERAVAILNTGNWDKSDIMTDYFNVGWYIAINVGRWDKPYLLTN